MRLHNSTKNWWWVIASAVFVSLFLVMPSVSSEVMDEAMALMGDGDFLGAAEISNKVGTSEGFALAANALAIHGYEIASEEEKEELFLRAIAYAEKAVDLDPYNSEAYLQVSHTLGRYAQIIGVAKALSGGFAEKTKAAMDKAISLDPSNYRAHLSLGSWHAEIVAAAGFMANLLYGANEEDSISSYQKALKLGSKSNVVHFEYAVGLMKLSDGDENLNLARVHLETAMDLPANTAYEQIVQTKTAKVLEEIFRN